MTFWEILITSAKLNMRKKKNDLDAVENNSANKSRKTLTNQEWIKIDKNINITDLITDYPDLAEVLTYDYGLHCVNCIISDLDTLENGAAIHGIEGKDFEEMVEHLENIINGKEDLY